MSILRRDLSAGSRELLASGQLQSGDCPQEVLVEIVRELENVVQDSMVRRYKTAAALVLPDGEAIFAPNYRGDVESNICAEARCMIGARPTERFGLCVNFLAAEECVFSNTSCGRCLQLLSDRGASEMNGDIRVVSMMPFREDVAKDFTEHSILSYSTLVDGEKKYFVNQGLRSQLLPVPWAYSGDSASNGGGSFVRQ